MQLARLLAFQETEWAPAKYLPAKFGDMAETRFLVEAVIDYPVRDVQPRRKVTPIEQKVAWLVDLFTRLERRDQMLQRSRV